MTRYRGLKNWHFTGREELPNLMSNIGNSHIKRWDDF